MNDATHFVDFKTWCAKCKRKNISESPVPGTKESVEYDKCNECLTAGCRFDGSSKPINFEEEK